HRRVRRIERQQNAAIAIEQVHLILRAETRSIAELRHEVRDLIDGADSEPSVLRLHGVDRWTVGGCDGGQLLGRTGRDRDAVRPCASYGNTPRPVPEFDSHGPLRVAEAAEGDMHAFRLEPDIAARRA